MKSTNKVNWDEVPSPERLGFVSCSSSSSSWTWHSLLHTNWFLQSDRATFFTLFDTHLGRAQPSCAPCGRQHCMNCTQITHTYWHSYTNIVHPPTDPLHISAEALIFINDKSILSAFVFCGDQMRLWLKFQVRAAPQRKLEHVDGDVDVLEDFDQWESLS